MISAMLICTLLDFNGSNSIFFVCRTCFFRIQRALSGGTLKFLEALNATYGSGVLTCDFDNNQLKGFLTWLIRNYFR